LSFGNGRPPAGYPHRVIVVIGSPTGRSDDGAVVAAGMAAGIAIAAAAAGRTVQLVGKIGDDPVADGVLLDLARHRVGHAALLRDPTRSTPLETIDADATDAAETIDPVADDEAGGPDPEPVRAPALEAADVDLGLRYLTDFAVVVVADPADAATAAIVGGAASWAEARMIVVVRGGNVPDGLPADVVVLDAPDADPDGAFAGLVGGLAASLDGGVELGTAFGAALAAAGWAGSPDD
jgi:hypothetical protein